MSFVNRLTGIELSALLLDWGHIEYLERCGDGVVLIITSDV